MSHIAVHYGREEGNPEKHKSFRQAKVERQGFGEITPYLVERGDSTRGYWELSDAGLGEFVEMDG